MTNEIFYGSIELYDEVVIKYSEKIGVDDNNK